MKHTLKALLLAATALGATALIPRRRRISIMARR